MYLATGQDEMEIEREREREREGLFEINTFLHKMTTNLHSVEIVDISFLFMNSFLLLFSAIF